VPLEKAWQLWEDRELIPKWMPWIRSVTVQPDDPKMSRWLLSTQQFGRDWEFSWLAQNLTPMQNQKVCSSTVGCPHGAVYWRTYCSVTMYSRAAAAAAQIHWRSVPGSTGNAIEIANRGQIRFYRKSPSSCAVKLTISYELPDVLVPFGNVSRAADPCLARQWRVGAWTAHAKV
jgi:uncharacterized membrane protein